MEQPILQEPGVQVTTARFVVGSATYPLGGITSVQTFTDPAKRGGAILGGIFGALLFIVGCAGSPVLAIIGFAIAAICAFSAYSAKNSYGVVIMTAGVQTRAVVSVDQGYVQRVTAALNNALAMR